MINLGKTMWLGLLSVVPVLDKGFDPAKAFGCGLLLVKPV
jgi:hypothetical protein